MQYAALQLMLLGKRSKEATRVNTRHNQEKLQTIVHYFLCLIRNRDKHHMTHWAMVTTIALHYRGIDNKQQMLSRNTGEVGNNMH
jgi:hypothetical protein